MPLSIAHSVVKRPKVYQRFGGNDLAPCTRSPDKFVYSVENSH